MGWMHDTIHRIRDQFAGRQVEASPPRDPVELALEGLECSDWRDRTRAIRDLAEMSDPRVVPALAAALDDEEELVRYEAAKQLGELRAPEAVEALRARLSVEQKSHVIGATARALSNMADIPTLIAALDDPKMKWSAAAQLGERQASEAIDALAARLSDGELSYEIILALRKIGDNRAVRHLLPLLQSPHIQLRTATAVTLGEIGCDEAAPALIALLADDNESAQERAVEALEAIGEERGLEAVAEWRRASGLKNPDLRAVLIIFTKEFSPKEVFVNSILDRMEARGQPYRRWMTDKTPLVIRVNSNALAPTSFLAAASVEFSRALNEQTDLEKVEYATFEGSDGISGVIVTLWNS